MSDYTPTTEEVRRVARILSTCREFDPEMCDGCDKRVQEAERLLNSRWLAGVKAEAVNDFVDSAIKPEKIMEVAQAGYNESVREVMAQVWARAYMVGISDVIADKGATMNPYRQGETE